MNSRKMHIFDFLIFKLRSLYSVLLPQTIPKPGVLKTEWEKELEDLRQFAKSDLVRYKPPKLAELEAKSNFSGKEIKLIYRGFKETCPSGVVTRKEFEEIFDHLFPHGDPSSYAAYVFETFDTDKNGSISFEEFLYGLSIISRGTMTEKLAWVFRVYDADRNNYISKPELRKIMQAVSDMMGHAAQPPATTEFLHDLTDFIFQKFDLDQDGLISKEDFLTACINDSTIAQSIAVFETRF